MGGRGSGNWYRFGSKTLVEACLYLDVNQFNRGGRLQAGQWSNLKWTNGANIGVKTMAGAIELSYTISRDGRSEQVCYQVPLTWTQCNYGGKRPWFICPGEGCGRRVGKLYLADKYFLCRHCNDLAYGSQREDRAYRIMRKAQKIYRKLGVDGLDDLYSKPKPKGMHQKTYDKLCKEAVLLEEDAMKAIMERIGESVQRLGASDLR